MVGYIVKNTSDITAEMWSACLCSEQTARKSLDGTKTLLKFEAENIPSIFESETILTRKETRQATQSEEWVNDNI